MKIIKLLFIFLLVGNSLLFAEMNFKIMSYNALNFDYSSSTRADYFKQIISEYDPDIIVMQEIIDQAGANILLNAFNEINDEYSAVDFHNGFDTDNMLYYKNNNISLLSQSTVSTALRDIGKYTLSIAENELIIYSCHLKASSGGENEEARLQEILQLRAEIESLPENTEYIIVGDMNFYSSSESAYQNLTNETPIIAEDLCNSVGNWHNSSYYSLVHTQSTRVESFGGGSTGGLDDKFDFIFSSPNFNDGSNIEYVNASFEAFGNDGNHYNQSINDGYNSAVSSEIADALYYASDHLPVCAEFSYDSNSEIVAKLFISEYIEGSSYNKAIEIFNGSGSEINLSAYSLEKDSNGNNSWSSHYDFSGVLADNEVFVLANSGADQAILDVADETNNSVINFNGDDQIRLLKNNVEIDRIGISGDVDFGKNVTYVRRDTVSVPKAGEQDPRSNGEWLSYASDVFQYLGAHTQIDINNPPVITEISHFPENPTMFDSVSIEAMITDSDGTLQTTICKWGLSEDSLENSINMIFSEDKYITEPDIPAQEIGVSVYFRILAIDDDSSETLSEVNYYIVQAEDDYYTINQIQGETDTSPYDDLQVATCGIVTAVFSNGYFLQDGMGAWNGIMIYDTNTPTIGDELYLRGTVDEYYGKTEIKSISQYLVLSAENELPEAVELSTNDAANEMYEGVLVKISDAECIEAYSYNEWGFDDGSGIIRIDDKIYNGIYEIGNLYNIVGIVDYDYGNYKIEPRSISDIEDVSFLQTPMNLEISVDETSINLVWNKVENAESYQIQYSENIDGIWNLAEGTFNEIDDIEKISWSCENPANSKMFYRVIAVK